MSPKKLWSATVLILTISLMLSACSAFAPAEPTPDLTILNENARQTVVAEITADAQANPTAVFTLPPTYTPYPTYTVAVTPTETPTPGPTETPKPSGNQAKFLYASTYPESKREYQSNEIFNIAFGFQNIGEVTWDPSYALIFVGGDQFTGTTVIPLGRNVAPGEKCEFNMGAFGSEDLRVHTAYWSLVTGAGVPVPGGGASFTYTAK
jgi:hypothetical protein